MSNLGFVGLGIMGKPMALNLIKGGHTLYLHSRSGVPAELTAAGGSACDSAKVVAGSRKVPRAQATTGRPAAPRSHNGRQRCTS